MIDVHTELHHDVQFEVQLAPQVVVGVLDIIKSYVLGGKWQGVEHMAGAAGHHRARAQGTRQAGSVRDGGQAGLSFRPYGQHRALPSFCEVNLGRSRAGRWP